METVNIIALGISIVLLILLGILYLKSRKFHVDMKLLLIAFLIVAIGNYLTTNDLIIIQNIGSILIGIGFFYGFFHYEAIARGSPHIIIMAIQSGLLCGAVACNVLIIILTVLDPGRFPADFSSSSFEILLIPDILLRATTILTFYLYSALILIMFGRAFQIIVRVHRISKSSATRTEAIGLSILFLYRILYLGRYPFGPEIGTYFSTFGLLCSIIGLLVLIVNYIFHADYLYLLPFPIHSFMLYNKNGMLFYVRKVEQKSLNMEDKDILMTGAFTAISALIQETLGGEAKIKHINAQIYQILFNRLPKDSGTFVVISYGETAFFRKSLQRFIHRIENSILTQINNQYSDLENLEPKLDQLIRETFPYVQFTSKK